MSCVKFDEKNLIWSACDAPMAYNSNISLGHILLRSMELYGSRIGQISDDTGERFTFEELRMKTIRAAQNLQKRGYGSKQVIGINAGNIPNVAPIALASLCLGCPINAMCTTYTPDIIRLYQMTKVSLIFCDIEMYDVVVECLNEVGINAKIFTFNGTKGDSEAVDSLFEETGNEEDFIPVEVDGINETAFIMTTSGTTGPGKGLRISHAVLFSEIETVNMRMYANGIVFNPSTLFWISGVLTLVLATVCGATRVITDQEFSLEMLLRIIKDHKVTLFECLPYDLHQMLKDDLLSKADLSSVKHVIVSGYKYPASVLEEFNSKLPNGTLHNIYGLSELGDVSIDFPHFSGNDSAGRLVNGVTVKIVDKQGNRCGIGMDGEICVKGRFKFLGYCGNKELTDEVVDSEEFFLTGDIGHIDKDGYLYIVDRRKNVINTRDEWIFPYEIEELLMKSPEIRNVCVVAVPDDEVFEFPAAFVVRANDSKITEADIHKIIEDNLLHACMLHGGVYFIDSIPVSTTKKPLRKVLQEKAKLYYKANLENEIKSNL